MTTWFRDYLYKPLGGNRGSEKRWLLNLFLVFVISGLWHGANWTFVVWGVMHGVVFVAESFIHKKFPKYKIHAFAGWLYLMFFYTVSMIAFRADNVQDLIHIYQQIFSFDYNFSQTIHELEKIKDIFPLTLSLIFIGFFFMKELNEEYAIINKIKGYENFIKPMFYVLLFVMIFIFGKFNSNEFLYFKF